jgi:type I restriction enzyme, R subunit
VTKEAKARLKINKLLEDAGWVFFDTPNQRANVVVEQNVNFDILGDDFEGDKGFIDYLLLDQQGKPLAVLEAKSESKDPVVGKQQAIDYALAKGCEYVILSNGNTSYFLELSKNAEELILNFPSQKQLTNLKIQKKAEPLLSIKTDSDWIAKSQGAIANEELRYLRDYQMEALHAIADGFDKGKRRFLLEMATGTGKTLLAAAVIKLFLSTGNAKRILFIVDTIELADQAEQNFKNYLKDYSITIFKSDKSSALQNEVVIATIQSLSTNQNYLKYFNSFDFDLLVSDEAHRSITGAKSRVIFEYFRTTKIGLTATPKDYLKGIEEDELQVNDPKKLERRILLDTYRTFGCESGIPTYRFDLQAAVSHKPPYLVNPIVYDKRSEKTNQMLHADGWKDSFIDSATGVEVEETFRIRDFERNVFSESLNELMCDELIKTAKRDPLTDDFGKTIVYCISQNHASKITRYLNHIADQMWPNKFSSRTGAFARQVTSSVQENQDLSKKFRNNQLGTTRVVVTVRMMTTGYDCPDLLNVVLMKPVFSVSDFIQMKGRGTRLHTFTNQLTNEKIEKGNFFLIDFFGVCEYFEQEYDYAEPLIISKNKKEIDEDSFTGSGESDVDPIYVLHGDLVYFGKDFILIDNKLEIGKECMRVDREAFKSRFEESVKALIRSDPIFASALTDNRIEETEQIASDNLLNKPSDFFSLDALRKIYERNLGLIDFLRVAGGVVSSFPDRFEVIKKTFSEFMISHPHYGFEKFNYLENIFECYFVNPTYREKLESGNLSVLDDQTLGGNVPVNKLTKQELYTLLSYMRSLRLDIVN